MENTNKGEKELYGMNKTYSILTFILIVWIKDDSLYAQQKMRIIESPDPDMVIVHKDGMNMMISRKQFGENANIMYFDTSSLLVGLDNHPYFLQIEPQVDISVFPHKQVSSFLKVKLLQISKIKKDEDETGKEFYPIPPWSANFAKIEYLSLDNVTITNLTKFSLLPIKHLLIGNVVLENREQVVLSILNFKDLKYLVHNNVFTTDEIKTIVEKRRDITVLLESMYFSKLEKREIVRP